MNVNQFEVEVTRVKDGDTFTGDIVIGVFGMILTNTVFRLYGVDTPERKEPNYYEATEFTANLIEGKKVIVDIVGKDAFGRLLVNVLPPNALSVTLNDRLLNEGLAVTWAKNHK